jgi:carbon monoxide dehydrogenase subunit G
MEFSGEEHFTQNREELYAKLTDLNFMSKTFPGLQKVEKLEPKRLVVKLKPGFSFIAGTLTNTMELVEEHPPESARIRVQGKGIGASVVVIIHAQLKPTNPGTTLAWQAEVTELGGLLKPVPRPLIEGAANKVVTDTWSAFRRQLGG